MIAAVVLAAGQSRRMGQPKINLPWGESTVLGHILSTLVAAGIKEIIIVIGDHPVQDLPVQLLDNVKLVQIPWAEDKEMLNSLQVGIRHLGEDVQAFLVVLGDQPQIQQQVVQDLVSEYVRTRKELIVPSYQLRRGHPWLAGRSVWNELLALNHPQTLRSFLSENSSDIHYLNVNTDTILRDIDTPDDYLSEKPATTPPLPP